VLDPGPRRQLERLLAAHERDVGHQVVVHTTPSLEGLPIEDYSIRVAEAWKIGHKGVDSGVILTVAPNERKVRIEVGYGLEGVLPDAIASRIIREFMLPRFAEGDLQGGVMAGVQQILTVAEGEPLARPPPSPRRARGRGRAPLANLAWLILIFLVFGTRGLFFLPLLRGGYRRGRRGGFGGGGFGGGGFGGGFGGGGGGFGGGGASGSW
jgi:uncharacterized protein